MIKGKKAAVPQLAILVAVIIGIFLLLNSIGLASFASRFSNSPILPFLVIFVGFIIVLKLIKG